MPTLVDESQYQLPTESGPTSFSKVPQMADSSQYEVLPDSVSGQSPDAPLDISPVDTMDRLRLSVGNTKGSIGYLKQKFEDVKYQPDHGLVVQKGGLWHKVDAGALGSGDAWQKTKELIGDLADLGDVGVNVGTAVGAGALTGITGGAASVPVMGMAGAVSGAIRSSLGRAVGTYDATPEERMKDVALESLLNMGGQVVALGVKPGLTHMANAIEKFGEKASPGVKQTMAKLFGMTAQVDSEHALRSFERPQVMQTLKGAASAGGHIEDNLQRDGITKVMSLFKDPWGALSGQIEVAENKALATVKSSASTHVGDVIGSAVSPLMEAGVLVPKAMSSETGKVLGWKLGSKETLQQFFSHPEGLGGEATVKAYQSLNKFLNLVNQYGASGEIKGAEGAKALINIRRGFDKFYFNSVKAGGDTVKEFLTPISSKFRTGLVKSLESFGDDFGAAYAQMNSQYIEALPKVIMAERAGMSEKSAQTFLNQLLQGPGARTVERDLVPFIGKLKGKAGQLVADSVQDTVAAHSFIRIMPQTNWAAAGKGAAAAVAGHAIGINPLLAAGALVASPAASPRFVGAAASQAGKAARAALPHMERFGDFVKTLPPKQMQQLIQDPAIFNQLVRTAVEAPLHEEQMTEGLLKQAGVK
jgi:hypothetical protein